MRLSLFRPATLYQLAAVGMPGLCRSGVPIGFLLLTMDFEAKLRENQLLVSRKLWVAEAPVL